MVRTYIHIFSLNCFKLLGNYVALHLIQVILFYKNDYALTE